MKRIELSGAPYFNFPASEKTNANQKFFVKEVELKPFPETKTIFSRRTPWS